LAEASFFAALAVATAERLLQQFQPTHESILSLVGCIPMVPGSIAANGLMNFSHCFAHIQLRKYSPQPAE
jgi:uncharacterized membrane protein YjjB (DUF3815 family)